MSHVARALQKPKLILQAVVERKPYFRRFRLSMIGFLAALGALYALNEVWKRDLIDEWIVNVGWLVAVVVAGLLFLHAVVNLMRGLTRHPEALRFYDKGFAWVRNGQQHRYAWSKIRTFREGGRGLYLGRRPLVQWGAHTLTMVDGQTFRITPRYGDLRRVAAAIRPYAAEVTGTRMGRLLRQGKDKPRPVRLHPRLTIWPGGVEIGKREIPWSALDVRVQNRRLAIRAKDAKGRFKIVKRYPVHTVDNLGGFVELATSTIRNHQPERFPKKSEPG